MDFILGKNNSGDIKILGRQRKEEGTERKRYEERQRRIPGLYAFRRPIRAAPGFGPARSVAWLLPAPALTHSLSALRLLRKRLSGPPNRRIQPERYAPLPI
jgi:hypothetical protein